MDPLNTKRCPTVGTMLGQRCKRWPNIELTLCVRLVRFYISYVSADKKHSSNACTILAHRLQRWANIVPALGNSCFFCLNFIYLSRIANSNMATSCSPYICTYMQTYKQCTLKIKIIT